MNKALKYIFEKIGWGGVMCIGIFIAVYTYMHFRVKAREDNARYIKGVSLGVQKGVRGSYHLCYKFTFTGDDYEGSVIRDFCDECPKCCTPGDTVIVRFEKDDPKNNDLVVKLPAGAAFSDQ